ncbi:MAG: hypothetical protein M3Q40_09530, partial [Pseudomonadota bacterium]|nr:hypothetical protein [Pseudomonadota bacterium]
AVALLAALALSPLLLVGAQAARYAMAADDLRSQAQALVRTVAPGAQGDAVAAAGERLSRLESVDSFSLQAGALFAAVQATPGARLDALEFRDGQLQARLVHPGTAELDRIRAALASDDWLLEETSSAPSDTGVASHVVLGRQP